MGVKLTAGFTDGDTQYPKSLCSSGLWYFIKYQPSDFRKLIGTYKSEVFDKIGVILSKE